MSARSPTAVIQSPVEVSILSAHAGVAAKAAAHVRIRRVLMTFLRLVPYAVAPPEGALRPYSLPMYRFETTALSAVRGLHGADRPDW